MAISHGCTYVSHPCYQHFGTEEGCVKLNNPHPTSDLLHCCLTWRIITPSLRVSDFRCGVNEIFTLLGLRHRFLGSYWRFGTTCQSYLLESIGPRRIWLLNPTLEDGTNRSSQNVGNYQSTLCNVPEEWCFPCLSLLFNVAPLGHHYNLLGRCST